MTTQLVLNQRGTSLSVSGGRYRIRSRERRDFVSDVFIPADLLTNALGLADTLVSVWAVASWDAVKQKIGWRAFKIWQD